MNDETITALAREYAEEIYGKELSNTLVFNRDKDKMEANLRWLLHRYALVEKSKLEELEIARRAKEHGAVWLNQWEAYALFPEIAKEVEG